MISFPNAKINIGLSVLEKRKDGFHNIESVVYPIDLYDILEVVENKSLSSDSSFTSSGMSIPGNSKDNLCIKAYRILKELYNLPPVSIHLHKAIPIGAGLGGGSADAAFMVKMLDAVFNLKMSEQDMYNVVDQLGSDCAFFVNNTPVLVSGKGDKLQNISLNLGGYYYLLLYPDIHVSTAEAYAGISPENTAESLLEKINIPVTDWKLHIKNDFELSVGKKYTEINTIKKHLYHQGAVYASMTGSGSAIFGIFKELPELMGLNKYTHIYRGKFRNNG